MCKKLLCIIMIAVVFYGCDDFPFPGTDDLVSDFEVSISDCDAPCAVFFTNLSMNADSYRWDFGDDIFSFEEHPVHIYDSPGEYLVTLTAFMGESMAVSEMRISVFSGVRNPSTLIEYAPHLNSIAIDITEYDDHLYVLTQSSNEGSALIPSLQRINEFAIFTKTGDFVRSIRLPSSWSISDIEANGNSIYVVGSEFGYGFIANVNPVDGSVIDQFNDEGAAENNVYKKVTFIEEGRPFIIGTVFGDRTSAILQKFDEELNVVQVVLNLGIARDLSGVDAKVYDGKIYVAIQEVELSTFTIFEVLESDFLESLHSTRVGGRIGKMDVDETGFYFASFNPTTNVNSIRTLSLELTNSIAGGIPDIGIEHPHPVHLVRHQDETILATSNFITDGVDCNSVSSYLVWSGNLSAPDFSCTLSCEEYETNGFITLSMISDDTNIYSVGFVYEDDDSEKVFLMIDDGDFRE